MVDLDMTPRVLRTKYFVTILLLPMVALAVWIALKNGLEHRLGPKNMGYQGLLANRDTKILFIGSSHTRQSYDARIVESVTGKSTYVLAYSSLDLTAMDVLIKDWVADRRNRPELVVLEAYSAFLARKPDLQDTRVYFDAPPPLKQKYAETFLSFHPGLSGKLDVFDLLVNRNNELILAYPVNRELTKRVSYKGSYIKQVPGVSEQEFRNFRGELSGSSPDQAQYASLEDMVNLLREHNIAVALVESPLPVSVSMQPDVQTLKAVFRNYAESRGVLYIDGDVGFPNDNPALFADSNHLSTEGRALYTKMVAEKLAAMPALMAKK
jgi:hypothetical protein